MKHFRIGDIIYDPIYPIYEYELVIAVRGNVTEVLGVFEYHSTHTIAYMNINRELYSTIFENICTI